MEIDVADHYVLVMYSRVASLLEGVRVLLEAQLAEEAIHLVRQMFTESLCLMELATCPNRAAVIVGEMNQSLNEIENLERQAVALGVSADNDLVQTRARLEERRQQMEAFRARRGLGKLKKFPDEKELARTHNRLEEYMDFRFAHEVVHRADMAQFARSVKKSQALHIALRNAEPDWRARVCAWAMNCALHAHAAVASIFGWKDTPQQHIDQLRAQIESDLT